MTYQVTDSLSESLDDFLHGGSNVRTMCEDNIDVRLFEALERALESLNDVLPAQATSVWLLASSSKEDLGSKHVLVAGPCKFFECLSGISIYIHQILDSTGSITWPISTSEAPLA